MQGRSNPLSASEKKIVQRLALPILMLLSVFVTLQEVVSGSSPGYLALLVSMWKDEIQDFHQDRGISSRIFALTGDSQCTDKIIALCGGPVDFVDVCMNRVAANMQQKKLGYEALHADLTLMMCDAVQTDSPVLMAFASSPRTIGLMFRLLLHALTDHTHAPQQCKDILWSCIAALNLVCDNGGLSKSIQIIEGGYFGLIWKASATFEIVWDHFLELSQSLERNLMQYMIYRPFLAAVSKSFLTLGSLEHLPRENRLAQTLTQFQMRIMLWKETNRMYESRPNSFFLCGNPNVCLRFMYLGHIFISYFPQCDRVEDVQYRAFARCAGCALLRYCSK